MDRKKMVEDLAKSRIIPFFGKLDGELYVLVQEQLLKLSSESKKSITILFDSVGGSAFLSFQLGDLITMLPCKVVGIVLQAASAACTVLQFCHERRISASGKLLVHKSIATADDNFLRFADDELFEKKTTEMLTGLRTSDAQLIALLVRRTGFPEEEVKKWIKEGEDCLHYNRVQEALQRKLVDSVLPVDFKLFQYDASIAQEEHEPTAT